MKDRSTDDGSVTVGLDVGDKHSDVCVLDAKGAVIEESRIRTTVEAVRRRFSGMSATRVALETGTHSNWIADELRSLHHEVVVANARKLRAIYQSDRKDDRDSIFSAPVVSTMTSFGIQPARAASCWRRARISSSRSARLRKAETRARRSSRRTLNMAA